MRLLLCFLTLVLFSCAPVKEEGPSESEEALRRWTHLSTVKGDLPTPGSSTQQTASLVLDIDRDGVNDIVIACRKAPPSMVWYRRGADGWARSVIDSTTLPIEAGGAYYDIDQDGDLDIVMGADASGDKMWWWENPCPDFSADVPWVRREIKSGGGKKHHDQMFGDFDGDSQVELVFWNQRAHKLFLADIPADPANTEPWEYTQIYTWSPSAEPPAPYEMPRWAGKHSHEGLAKADIDGDGKLDIIGGGRWFKHVDGMAFKAHEIDPGQFFTRAAAGQLKKGGRPEVVFVVGDGVGPIMMYEWNGSEWTGRDLLGHDVDHGHSLQIIDLDRDGNLDIFCAEMRVNSENPDAKIYAFLGNGQGHFKTVIVADGYGNHETKAADLDGDGDIDILGKPYNWETPRLDIWLNRGKAFHGAAGIPFE